MIITLEQFKFNAYNEPSYVYKATQGDIIRYANTRERAIREVLGLLGAKNELNKLKNAISKAITNN